MHFLSLISIYILSFIEISTVFLDLCSIQVKCDGQNSKSKKGDNLKIINYRVMVLV